MASTAGTRKRAAEKARIPDSAYAALTWTDVPHLQAQVEDLLVREMRIRGWCSEAERIGEKLFAPRVGTKFVDSDGVDCNGNEARDTDGYGLVSGLNRHGYDRDGFDRDGRDIRGFDREGMDRHGVHRDDPARFRFDADGWDPDGFNRDGYDALGFNREGRDSSGYDRDGLDDEGRDRNGRTADGVTRDGKRYDERDNWYLVDLDAFKARASGRRYAEMSAAEVVQNTGAYIEGLGVEGEPLPSWWTPECEESVKEYLEENGYDVEAGLHQVRNPHRTTAAQNITYYQTRLR